MDQVELDFLPGFTTVTGETGAGKSVLLGALSLLSGARAEKSIIRQGQDCCEVEASLYFEEAESINTLLESMHLPACEEGILILHRTLFASKSQKVLVNGTLTTLANLQKIGGHWIDFHGPGEPQKLFDERYQLEMLDLYAKSESALERYRGVFQARIQLLNQIQKLSEQEQLSPDELDFYQTQLNKIKLAAPSLEAITKLEEDFARISNAESILTHAKTIGSTLSSELYKIQPLLKTSAQLTDLLPGSGQQELHERLHSLVVEAEDLASEFSQVAEEAYESQENPGDINTKMNLWLEVQRKYGPTPEAVFQKREALREKLESQSGVEGKIIELEKQVKQLEKDLLPIARELGEIRKAGAEKLSGKVVALLKKLGFQKAVFAIEILEEKEFKSYGNTRCQFLFSANPGQVAQPLNKIASSGETARVMLALKTLLAESDKTPLLVFDEVDANVGGEIAVQVANELANLSREHQVFCITHLPQVAAKGHNHFLVEKRQTETETRVEIGVLRNEDERVHELARMLGDRNSKAAISHAEELLGVAIG